MRGILKTNQGSKIFADGRTYDSKLYTFKECDYQEVWLQLDVVAKKLNSKSLQNLPQSNCSTFNE